MGVARVRDIGPRPIMDKFVARYTKEYNQPVATSENILNYCAMRILAAAMESAGTTEDLLAIKKAIDNVLPMEPEKRLIYYAGILGTRLIVPASVQSIENGAYTAPTQSIWWTKSETEFKKIVADIPERGAISRHIPLKGYTR